MKTCTTFLNAEQIHMPSDCKVKFETKNLFTQSTSPIISEGQRWNMEKWACCKQQLSGLTTGSGGRLQLPPPPPHHPVISLEAGPDMVPVPSGWCHLSPFLPAALWLHHSTTIVIKMVIFVWRNKRDYFSKLWVEVLQDTIQPTLSNRYWCLFKLWAVHLLSVIGVLQGF